MAPVLLQTYLPSGLFVVVSWISFIVPPEIVPGKHQMDFCLKLTMGKKSDIVIVDSCYNEV